jgi:hypothetical protein
MPPIPPMPPPGKPVSFFGLSATMASVVIRSPAIDAAFCSAARIGAIRKQSVGAMLMKIAPGSRNIATVDARLQVPRVPRNDPCQLVHQPERREG